MDFSKIDFSRLSAGEIGGIAFGVIGLIVAAIFLIKFWRGQIG